MVEVAAFGELLHSFGASIYTGDWESVRRLLHPDFRHVMHKQVSRADFDPDEFIENGRVWKDLAGSVRDVVREVLRHNNSAVLMVHDLHGVDEQGMETQWSGLVIAVGDGGLILHWEEFDPDDLDAAIARYEELTSR